MGARSTLPPALSGASLGLGGTSTVPDTLPADAPVDGDSVARFDVPEALRYDEGGTIGQGGMGIVRSARDQRLGREVALKLPRRGQVDGEARLVQEATLTAGLFHPGIVPVYGAGRHPDGRPYYTMPVLRGTSLAEALGRATDLESRLAYVRHFLDATEAVAYAHSRGVLHRDLKPANIMVGEFGETHVVDWGLAGQVGAPAAQRNSEGRKVVAGTPGYMSPEQRAGGVLGTESDVFSLGAVMWEILTGQLPPAEGRLPVLAVTPGAPPRAQRHRGARARRGSWRSLPRRAGPRGGPRLVVRGPSRRGVHLLGVGAARAALDRLAGADRGGHRGRRRVGAGDRSRLSGDRRGAGSSGRGGAGGGGREGEVGPQPRAGAGLAGG